MGINYCKVHYQNDESSLHMNFLSYMGSSWFSHCFYWQWNIQGTKLVTTLKNTGLYHVNGICNKSHRSSEKGESDFWRLEPQRQFQGKLLGFTYIEKKETVFHCHYSIPKYATRRPVCTRVPKNLGDWQLREYCLILYWIDLLSLRI